MKESDIGLTTPEQARRAAEFAAVVERLRTDGYFTTASGVAVGDSLTIDHEGKTRTAEVVLIKHADCDLLQVYFKWTDKASNA